jgi:hypothetical protein
MHRVVFLFSVAVLFSAPTLAQTSSTAPAKASAKKAAPVSAPEGAKPRPRLLTIDQLRRCMKLKEDSAAEGVAVEGEKTAVELERAKIVEDRTALQKLVADRDLEAKAIVAEQAAIVANAKEFEKPVDKSEMAALNEKRIRHNAMVETNKKRVDDFNASRNVLNATSSQLDQRIAASNARLKAVGARVDEHNYNLEDWKADCMNRPYDEADEATILKERGK